VSPRTTVGSSVSRRRLLLAAGAALAVGAGGAEAVDRLSGGTHTASQAVAPGETLMYEHGVLKRVLLIYQNAAPRAEADPSLAAAAIHGGAEIIHDFIEGFHEALEEGYVFPTLKAAGRETATIRTLLLQHARGRLITQFLLATATAEALGRPSTREQMTGAVRAFVRMYEPHEAREDTVIFPAFRSILTPRQLDGYGRTFTDLQTRQFGRDGFATVVARVAALEESLGIYDLAEFTPAAVNPNP